MKRLTLDDVICPVCCVVLPLDNDGCPECGHQDQLQGRIPPIRAYSDRLHYPGMRALIGRTWPSLMDIEPADPDFLVDRPGVIK